MFGVISKLKTMDGLLKYFPEEIIHLILNKLSDYSEEIMAQPCIQSKRNMIYLRWNLFLDIKGGNDNGKDFVSK